MKITVHYDSENSEQDLVMNITLPKKWIGGPFSKLVKYTIDFHKKKYENSELAEATEHHMVFKGVSFDPAVLVSETTIDKGADVYIKRGISPVSADKFRQMKADKEREEAEEAIRLAAEKKKAEEYNKSLVQCKRFGCTVRFNPAENTDETACRYHVAPPIFHETAKWWSCCPQKKAFDWEKFQLIPGCQVGVHSTEKADTQFLGGSDMRGGNDEGPKLQSIDDFNTAKEKSSALEILGLALQGVGMSADIFERARKSVLAECGGDEAKAAKVFENKLSVALEMMNSD